MISLYDYLGKAAGAELGKKVWNYARIRKPKRDVRNISNPKYKGKVMIYEKGFLDEFFKVQKIFMNIPIPIPPNNLETDNSEDEILPF
jgi:hypothetical protein